MKQIKSYLYLLTLFLWMPGSQANAQIVIVVNDSNQTSDLSLNELEKIYLGKITTFSNGKGILLVEYAPLTEKFYHAVLRKTPMKVKKHWISVVFSGGSGTPPTICTTVEQVKNFITKNPGAISFIDMVDVNDSVKVLTIGGKNPGDDNYPLKLE